MRAANAAGQKDGRAHQMPNGVKEGYQDGYIGLQGRALGAPPRSIREWPGWEPFEAYEHLGLVFEQRGRTERHGWSVTQVAVVPRSSSAESFEAR